VTINNFDENIDGIKLDNIVMIMTIINVNGSLTAFGDDYILYASLRAMALHSTILRSLASLRARALRSLM
jgi:hypothetical protein